MARKSNNTVDIGAVETSAFVVTNSSNTGAGSLRDKVSQATDITTTITFDPTLTGSTITLTGGSGEIALASNVAIDASALSGGMTISGNGVTRIFTAASGKTIALTGLTLTGGNGASATANGSGGAIYNNGATLTLNQCTLANNTTSGTNALGGAIRVGSGTLALNRCTVANNTANTSGANAGGIGGGSGTVTLTQCTLAGNSTTGFGGAIRLGGAGSLAVTQCTVAGNSAASGGGGIDNSGTTKLTNSIVAKNTGATGADINNVNGIFTRVGANIIQSFVNGATATNSGPAAINADPLLAPLGNYGGPTQTMALEPGSPARNTAVGSTVTSDQRGFSIVGAPDIGAYEAGTLTNFNAWIWELLPATASVAQHASTFDFDGDGVNNGNEFLAQTNPGDPTSYLRVTQTTRTATTLTIAFPSVAGRNYSVEASTDLSGWTQIDGPLTGTGSTLSRNYIFPGGIPPRYFIRVRGGP